MTSLSHSSPPSFLSLVEDIFRCWDPERFHRARTLAAAASARGIKGENNLARELEEEYGINGYFTNYGVHFAGRFFDAKRALYDGHVVPPIPAASPFDNVHKAQALLPDGIASGDAAPIVIATGRLHSKAVQVADAQRRKHRTRAPPLEQIAATATAAAAASSSPFSFLSRALSSRAIIAILVHAAIPPPYDAPAIVIGRLISFDADGNVLLQSACDDIGLRVGESLCAAARAAHLSLVFDKNTLTLILAARIVSISIL
jgi:hypothetical protein